MADINRVVRWEAYEHEHIERSTDWYIALAIIALSGAITSILFHNVLFAVVVLMAAVSLWLLSKRPPELMFFELSDKGIRIGEHLHRYSELACFWVEDEQPDIHGRPLLLVSTKKLTIPHLIIPIEQVNPAYVRAYLSERMREVHMTEPIGHKILDFFGF